MHEKFVGRDGVWAVEEEIYVRGSRTKGHGVAYPKAADLLHWMFMVLHWAVVGFGNGMVGSSHPKNHDW